MSTIMNTTNTASTAATMARTTSLARTVITSLATATPAVTTVATTVDATHAAMTTTTTTTTRTRTRRRRRRTTAAAAAAAHNYEKKTWTMAPAALPFLFLSCLLTTAAAVLTIEFHDQRWLRSGGGGLRPNLQAPAICLCRGVSSARCTSSLLNMPRKKAYWYCSWLMMMTMLRTMPFGIMSLSSLLLSQVVVAPS